MDGPFDNRDIFIPGLIPRNFFTHSSFCTRYNLLIFNQSDTYSKMNDLTTISQNAGVQVKITKIIDIIKPTHHDLPKCMQI